MRVQIGEMPSLKYRPPLRYFTRMSIYDRNVSGFKLNGREDLEGARYISLEDSHRLRNLLEREKKRKKLTKLELMEIMSEFDHLDRNEEGGKIVSLYEEGNKLGVRYSGVVSRIEKVDEEEDSEVSVLL